MKLNLGCSDDIRPGYINVDNDRPDSPLVTDANFRTANLACYWPWDTSSIDEIVAHDVFEHIDNLDYRGNRGIVWCMNEAHRVLKPGGILDLVVPCLPGDAPFVDPTHCQVWTDSHRYYFDERWNNSRGERGRLGPAYGITALFRTLPESRSGLDWTPVQYAKDAPSRHKLMLKLEAVK